MARGDARTKAYWLAGNPNAPVTNAEVTELCTISETDFGVVSDLDASATEINTICVPAQGVEDVTATNVITAAESGKTFFLNSATEFVSTLPAPAAGLNYTFIVKAAPSGANYTVVTNGGADIMIGMVTCATADDLGQYDANADVITFVGGASIVGDWVRVISDGTSWYFSGASHVAEGITSGTT